MTATLHVVPIGNLVERASEDDCSSGPTARPVVAGDGSIGWLMIHYSLAGRDLASSDH